MPELKNAELINGIVHVPSPFSATENPDIPPLENGDHLTVEEFERRYVNMPTLKKAELINGVVYMGSPVSMDRHGSPHTAMTCWLGTYHAYTLGTQSGDNTTLKLQVGLNQPQPDNMLRILPKFGGKSKTDAKGYVSGSVELVTEVSANSATFDLHEKKEAYEQNGVLEYVVWRVEERAIDWFVLKRGKYRPLAVTKNGLYTSKAFPGLWLDADSMIAGDLAKVIEVVQKGIDSPEHKRFVAKLKSKKK